MFTKITVVLQVIIILINYKLLCADSSNKGFLETESRLANLGDFPFNIPSECKTSLDNFADTTSSFTKCTIKYSRPVRLCEKCIVNYMIFREKYQELLNTNVNGTSCKHFLISQDRLNSVLDYYDNLMMLWDKGNCNGCYDWSNSSAPVLSNNTVIFYQKYRDTKQCIINNGNEKENYTEICENCKESYMYLNDFYEKLSTDSVALDTICMDVIDAMNVTRSIWSKTLNCCKLRKSPEIIFLCCTAIISALPLLYYLAVRYCGPIRDLPNVLKQSRLKQSFLRTVNGRIN